MNAPSSKMTGIEEIDISMSIFNNLRSEVLDCFADIERSLLSYVTTHGQKGFCATAPLGHKIEAAKKVPAGPRRSRELKAKADAQLSKLAELLPVRADLVHSRMEVAVTTSSELLAIFKNAKVANTGQPDASVFSVEQLQRFVITLKSLKKSIDKALSEQNPQHPPKNQTQKPKLSDQQKTAAK